MLKLANRTLSAVSCPKCDGQVKGIVIDEDSITNAKRVQVLVSARCSNDHPVVLFVDQDFTIRAVVVAGAVVQEPDIKGAVDKAQKWMDIF
ncbi:MAG: hypothetical protein P1Q69_15760 [Candidatus Thorarchaeota archaeon]|nr:hypothetical protein [Candidatus Thorarchaeota archaeon]